jgi:hypothetical protein
MQILVKLDPGDSAQWAGGRFANADALVYPNSFKGGEFVLQIAASLWDGMM